MNKYFNTKFVLRSRINCFGVTAIETNIQDTRHCIQGLFYIDGFKYKCSFKHYYNACVFQSGVLSVQDNKFQLRNMRKPQKRTDQKETSKQRHEYQETPIYACFIEIYNLKTTTNSKISDWHVCIPLHIFNINKCIDSKLRNTSIHYFTKPSL